MLRSVSLPPPPPPSPERGRLRGRLEGGLAGLCELHLLRQRHERRVRQALRLAAAGPPPPHTEPEPESDTEPDPLDFLPALLWELEQRVGGLRLHPETPSGDTPAWPGPGFYAGAPPAETPDSAPFPRQGQGPGERPKSVGDAGGAGPRPPVPRSLSAPEHPLGTGGGLISPPEAPSALPSPGGAESYISRLLRRRARGPPLQPPRTSLAPEPGLSRQNSLRQRPASERRGPERGASAPAPVSYEGGAAAAPRAWASWDERTPAPGARTSSPPQPRAAAAAAAACRRPPKLHALRPEPADSGMVQARYIPARGARKKPPALAKGRAVDLSLERAPGRAAMPKKCRFAEERRGHRAARSQSENSLVGQGGPMPAAPATSRPAVARGGYRKWRSTAEICPEEGARGPRRGPARPALCAEAESDSEGSGGGGPSESSPSEAASAGSGSGSSDSEGSGAGLVWPQAPGPGRPNLFVKIKASHALKKKILRFRSGSLKVMTTV